MKGCIVERLRLVQRPDLESSTSASHTREATPLSHYPEAPYALLDSAGSRSGQRSTGITCNVGWAKLFIQFDTHKRQAGGTLKTFNSQVQIKRRVSGDGRFVRVAEREIILIAFGMRGRFILF